MCVRKCDLEFVFRVFDWYRVLHDFVPMLREVSVQVIPNRKCSVHMCTLKCWVAMMKFKGLWVTGTTARLEGKP